MQSTKEIEAILHYDLENWLRWGRKKDWMPVSFRCPLGFLYKTPEGEARPPACDELEAVRFERIVVGLPQRHRQAFVMYHLERIAVNSRVKIIKGRDDRAALLGIQKSRYHELVQQASNMVLRDFEKASCA